MLDPEPSRNAEWEHQSRQGRSLGFYGKSRVIFGSLARGLLFASRAKKMRCVYLIRPSSSSERRQRMSFSKHSTHLETYKVQVSR
jgi:hypothetical protein